MKDKKRYTFTVSDNPLPLFIESIGYNTKELDFDRPEGYPYYHWLQTYAGEGIFHFADREFRLTPGKAVFLTPYTPHFYYSDHNADVLWSTWYMTFSGAAIDQILNALNMNYSAIYEETDAFSFTSMQKEMLVKIDESDQYLEYESSSDLYHFLLMLKKYGKTNSKLSISQSYRKIKPIVEWLELNYSRNIGLLEISERAKVSSQRLNTLFHDAFGISPYSFLVQLRIREAKRLLITDTTLTLEEITNSVGFNSVSHFVSTFKKREGITPSVYRSLYC
ncbi:AraC family transcriptional regulator [Bacillus sp. SD088]|uniref:AraC family transcriptional regulator n=1 Tax=Bacillus sp. SD088 TaxID=2782012 RepID=UPI001A965AE9|nr:AraC family transcriptional regulator [Bacillus sp. SD088]MBO0993104.1 AraC family transcriptional regulator [Bacillus sp. SD088]